MNARTKTFNFPFRETNNHQAYASTNVRKILDTIQIQDQAAAEEESLQTRLEAGALIEPDDHSAVLRENLHRNVSWTDVVCRLAELLGYDSDAYTSSVLTHQATRSISLVVEDQGEDGNASVVSFNL